MNIDGLGRKKNHKSLHNFCSTDANNSNKSAAKPSDNNFELEPTLREIFINRTKYRDQSTILLVQLTKLATLRNLQSFIQGLGA